MPTTLFPPPTGEPRAAHAADETLDGVRLWFTRTGAVGPALAARCHALLTPDERVQQQRFLFEKDRHRYLVTRALVREVMGGLVGRAPQDVRFEANDYGKPRVLDGDPAKPAIEFNLSHTDDLVILAATRGRPIGIDVESTRRAAPLEIAQRYFAPSETAAMRRLPLAQQPQRFWQLWTLKESYIKAYGMGLSIPLDGFHFDLDSAPGQARLGFGDGWRDDAGRWAVWLFRPVEGFQGAVCVGRSEVDGAGLGAVQIREVRPLEGRAIA